MLAERLRTILVDTVLVSSESGTVVLRQKAQRVEVSQWAADGLVINLDRIGELSGLKDGDWKKRCDYMLVYRVKEKDRVLFVEMKKTLRNNKERAFEQLRRSLPLFDYLDSVCAVEFGLGPDQPEPEVQYVLIAEKSYRRLDKQPVRADRPQCSEHTYKDITVTTLVGPRFGSGRLWNG